MATPSDVLEFWFGAYPLDLQVMQQEQARWFQKNEAFDAELRDRFLPTIEAARAGHLDQWAQDPASWLALLIVLDQFPRNAFRGQPDAFASDAQALRVALAGIERGHDKALPPMARVFCYLPLEHAEDLAMQRRSVALFSALVEAPDAEPADFLAVTLDFAHKHLEVIERFGRFPHRNAVLGRVNTAAEQDYLAQPGAGF
ncbi:DUF924 family protein [Ottowia sp.]|uniref:DUF924 family protein n=1 Tax=Ottowia sp. TaxID=1898956 RepID=UPI002D12454E|nr:DUF924 family protein [Ottowia sp.]HRN77363.1 DUF924 family protein [Ottowia sp.]